MRNWSRLLAFFVVVLMAGLVPVLAQETSQASITLLTPDHPIAVEATFDVVVQVNTGSAPVDAAAVYLNFDPALFRIERVQPGTALPVFLQSVTDNVQGQLGFAAGQFAPNLPAGTFTLLTVTLRALAPAEAALITLEDSNPVRTTDLVLAGESVLESAVGAVVMVTNDAALLPEDVDAVRSSADQAVATGDLFALDPMAVEDELILATVSVPFSANMAAAEAWVADGGWAMETDGSGFAADGSAAATAANLRLLHPVSLAGLTDAQAEISYQLSAGAQARLELRTAGNPNWSTIAVLPASPELTSFPVSLNAYLGQTVQLRFVMDAAGVWSVDSLSVTGSLAGDGVAAPVAPEVVLPEVLPEAGG